MKAPSILLMTILVIGSMVSSCNPEEDDDNNDGTNVFADLTFSYSVTGEINQSGNWESPENNQNLGGHNNSIICNYSGTDDQFLIVGIGDDYSFSVEADIAGIAAGTYDLTDVIFSDNQSSFEQVSSGTITFDEVEVNFSNPPTTYYTIRGSFTSNVNNSSTPPESIAFNGTFEGLNVIAVE